MSNSVDPIDTALHAELETFLSLTKRLLSDIHKDPRLHRALRAKGLQEVWENLHLLSLFGMNAVSGGHLPESGEEVTLKLLDASFPSESVHILDVGANHGDYSALALEMVGKRAKIWAFEPLPGNFEKLKERFLSSPQVVVVNSAVGKAHTELPFYVDGEVSTLGSLIARRLEHEGNSLQPRILVPVVRLTEWVESIGLHHIHLLKIDVEGADLDVLVGAKALLDAGRISLIQFEFSAAQIDARHFFKDFFGLLSPKYTLYRIVGDGLVEVSNYTERYEVFSCINYLAVVRS